jgi:hypothetical protein
MTLEIKTTDQLVDPRGQVRNQAERQRRAMSSL